MPFGAYPPAPFFDGLTESKGGIDTTVKRKQNKAKQDAEAMAKAAERERRKNSKKTDVIPAATPMLFRPDEEE